MICRVVVRELSRTPEFPSVMKPSVPRMQLWLLMHLSYCMSYHLVSQPFSTEPGGLVFKPSGNLGYNMCDDIGLF